MKPLARRAISLLFLLGCVNLFAAGSGLNIVVVVNQNSTNSLQLGNYYCEKRGVPPQNVLRINWPGGNILWTRNDFETVLRAPLNAMLTSRQVSNQVDYVLLSMDIPYVITNSAGSVQHNFTGTVPTLYYGFKDNPQDPFVACTLASGSASAYAGSEGIFRQTPPINATSNSWLVTMITSTNLVQAKAIVDRGVASDSTFPTQTVYLAKSGDPFRNIRYLLYDNALFNSRLRGNIAVQLTNTYTPANLGLLFGYQNGVQLFGLAGTNFVPGAMADNLSSFSGNLLEGPDHTHVGDFLNAGATASYGTIVEPCAYFEKFASPQNYFYQARGFSIAECYYLSITNPYQGIVVGEPLCAPFAVPAAGSWNGLPVNPVLGGTTNLSLQFTAPDRTRPVQQVKLFVDGTLSQTITNLAPAPGNVLYVTLPGGTNMSYSVPAAATIASVANGLAGVINAASNATKVTASVFGDRLELRSTDLARSGSNTFIVVSNHIGAATMLNTAVHVARSNFLDAVTWGLRTFLIGTGVVSNDFLAVNITKTNGAVVSAGITNFADSAPLDQFVQGLMNVINTNAALQGSDGVVAEDLVFYAPNYVQFNLRARSKGAAAAQIQEEIFGPFAIMPAGINRIDENVGDLQPRNHLYVTAGLTNLPLTFGFNTLTQADGFHELTAVAYEGTHVQTQKRIAQAVRIQNTTLSATLTPLVGDTNSALEATLQFSVVANTNTITRIELFSTGGSWGVISNLSSVTFSVAATNLGIGLHPFYAIVMRTDGVQYRTDTKWLRIVGEEPAFKLTVVNTAPRLSWPATAGRRYEILSTISLTNPFILRDAVTPTNSVGLWSETNSSSQRFYRARATP